MLKNSEKSARRAGRFALLSAVALAAGAAVVAPSTAFAQDQAAIKEMSFTTQSVYNQVIRVVSTDDKKWNKIEPGSVMFGAHINIDTKYHGIVPGWVDQVGVVLGACGGATCVNRPTMWTAVPDTKDFETQKTLNLKTNQIPVSTNGIATVPLGDEIIASCNSKATMDGGKKHSFNKLVPVTLVANTTVAVSKRDLSGIGGGTPTPPFWGTSAEHSKTSNFVVKVQCEPFQREKAEDVEDVNMVTKDIELKVVAPANPTTKPNKSTVCRKGKLTVRMEANRVGPVKYRLWSKVGDAAMTSKVIDMWAKEVAPGNKFVAEHSEWVAVPKTSTVKAMAEDMINPIGQSTGWKEALVRCEPAIGGMADQPKPNNDGGVVPLKLTGELTLADQTGTPKDKPRLGQAVFKIWSNRPGQTSYVLTCSGGRKWEGTLPTYKVGQYKYQAVGAANLQISKTEQIGCALRSTSKKGNPVLALATKLFKLVKVNPSVGGGGDTITGKPRPTHDKPSGKRPNKRPAVIVTPKPPKRPKMPAIKVAPLPKLVCINGKVSRSNCFCLPRTVKKQIGARAYRCDRAVAKPKRVTPKATPKRVIMTAPVRQTAPKRAAPKRATPKRAVPNLRRSSLRRR